MWLAGDKAGRSSGEKAHGEPSSLVGSTNRWISIQLLPYDRRGCQIVPHVPQGFPLPCMCWIPQHFFIKRWNVPCFLKRLGQMSYRFKVFYKADLLGAGSLPVFSQVCLGHCAWTLFRINVIPYIVLKLFGNTLNIVSWGIFQSINSLYLLHQKFFCRFCYRQVGGCLLLKP